MNQGLHKVTLILLFFLILSKGIISQCHYVVDMQDSYGDGWNGASIDIYINGYLRKRHELSSIPKQNFGDLWLNLNGGFDGYISDLRYWNYGLSIGKIAGVISKGPDLTMSNTAMKAFPNYLSLRWFMNN